MPDGPVAAPRKTTPCERVRRFSRSDSPTARRSQHARTAVIHHPIKEFTVIHRSNLALVITLLLGMAVGWAGASGRFDSLLRVEPQATAAPPGSAPDPEGGCCTSPDKASALFSHQRAQPEGVGDPPKGRQEAEHPRHLGRRHRHHQRQRLQRRADGLCHTEHRPHRQRRAPLPSLLRRTVMHRGPSGVPDRAARHPYRVDQGGIPRCTDGPEPT